MKTTKLSRQAEAPAVTSSAPKSKRLLRLPEVLHRVGVSRTTWWRLIKAGVAPAPVKITPRVAAWPDESIDAFIESRG